MIGLFASIFPIGGILGPNLGGAIIEHFGWREIFLVNVPIGVAVIGLLARQAIPRAALTTARRATKRTVDLMGTAMFATMVVRLLLTLPVRPARRSSE